MIARQPFPGPVKLDYRPVDLQNLLTLHNRSRKRRNYRIYSGLSYSCAWALIIYATILIGQARAAYVTFDNCLSSAILTSNPAELQWVPLWVDAIFDETSPSHNLNITVYGNVTGQSTLGPYPPPSSPAWNDPKDTFGKIVDISPTNNVRSTLYSRYNVLTYTPYDAPASAFCDATINTACPIAPAFSGNISDPATLPAFSVAHEFYSSYAFATIATTITIKSGDKGAPDLACISANLTPNLGTSIAVVLTYIPVIVLIFVAIATVFAATYSPWGSTDPLRWTSNYGRDQDLLRLVTPGFGDCLQYIQFIVLAGSLSLNYPGYFQPAISHVGWSALMFNESFVSRTPGRANPVDGLYVTNGTYGLGRISQLIGMQDMKDVWTGMVIWLLVIIGFVLIVSQIGFFIRWGLRALTNNPEEDLRKKNWPFTAGNLVRVMWNYFLLPIVSLSMFQLLVAAQSPGVVVAFAVILLVVIMAFAGWILRLIFSTKPRAILFDDLPTVLIYGPLYNTYSDDAASYALIPILLTFIRGVAIGAIQPSGIAQLVVLAICEVILILTLHAFRPFYSPTSMNAYHTGFASVRLIIILLMIAFVPSLGVIEAPKGWIGYLILLLHAIVLIFGYFLNAIQTIIEVAARLAGAGGEEETGAAARGGLSKVFGVRQLSRRARRPGFRSSMNSDAAMLADDSDAKSLQYGVRSRSVSANSAILLNRRSTPDRLSHNLDQQSPSASEGDFSLENRSYSILPSAAAGAAATGYNKRADLALRTVEPVDPYYRAPRPRRATGEFMTPGAQSRGVIYSGDWAARNNEDALGAVPQREALGQPLSLSQPAQGPSPAYMRSREDSDSPVGDPRGPNVDYAVREVDFYYGVRGPALSNLPTRKLKTGPADPVGPVSSATGWFKGIFGGKAKESNKGFEVVRSSRAPPQGYLDETSPEIAQEPYQDSPQQASDGFPTGPGQRTRANGDHHQPNPARDSFQPYIVAPNVSPTTIKDDPFAADTFTAAYKPGRISDQAPSLSPIDTGGGLDIPSRIGSRISHNHSRSESSGILPVLPEKSTRRMSLQDGQIPGSTSNELAITKQFHDTASQPSRLSFPEDEVSVNEPRTSFGGGSVISGVSAISLEDASAVIRNPYHRAMLTSVLSVHAADASPDGPTSTGRVTSYRAGDGVQSSNYSAELLSGSAAQVVGAPRTTPSGTHMRPNSMAAFDFNL